MNSRLEVADVFRHHGDAYRQARDGHLGRVERRVMSAIKLCRTAELGGQSTLKPSSPQTFKPDCPEGNCAQN